MKVNITEQEYRKLLDMLGIASWVLQAHRKADATETADYRQVEQKFYALASEYGCEDLIVYDQKEDQYRPTAEYEEEGPVFDFVDEYNDETFWEELVERLAMRDVLSRTGQEEFHSMGVEERLEKLDAAIGVYEKEFAKNGLDRLAIDS